MLRILYALLLPFFCLLVFGQCIFTSLPPNRKAVLLYRNQLSQWKQHCWQLQMVIAEKRSSHLQQQAFATARKGYKKLEAFAEYFHPGTARAINGANVAEVEADEPDKVIEPTGFQVLEEVLFPSVDTSYHSNALAQAKALVSLAQRLQNSAAQLEFTDAQIWDALRLQLFRMQTIGISGGDSPIALASVPEAITVLQAVNEYLECYPAAEEDDALQTQFQQCLVFLEQAKGFESLDRATFFSTLLNPLERRMHSVQQTAGIPFFTEARALRANAATLFDKEAFNPWYYSLVPLTQQDTLLVQLGKRLFADTRLSGNNKRSCATCHIPQRQFADGLAGNTSFDGKQNVLRNTPALMYAALQPVQFADSRTAFLEDQARAVIESHAEMKGNLEKACSVLSDDIAYRRLVQKQFATDTLRPAHVQKALAAYTRSLPRFQSRLDLFMRGEANALSKEEQRGFTLFMGKAKCGTCHFMPLFNGVVPPHFERMESEVLGVPAQAKPPYTLDNDLGKARHTGSPVHRNAFKTPTLRNSAGTAPYMHNGVFQTLEEVVKFYNKGGGRGLGIKVENQTLPANELGLSDAEEKAIVQFLRALSDE